MLSENPFSDFAMECKENLASTVQKLFPKTKIKRSPLETPSNPRFGQLASSMCFELAKQLDEDPRTLASMIAEALSRSDLSLVEKVVPAGGGYVNFHANFGAISPLTINSIRHFDRSYGLVKTNTPLSIIVEHTSANPLHPMHIGQARNPMLGDAIARILKARGHKVARHFYVDDVGRQSAVLAYGYEKLGKPTPDEKPDHFLGKIYTVTSSLVEINRLKRLLDKADDAPASEEMVKTRQELDEWMTVAAELKEKYPELFETLLGKIGEDPEKTVNELNQEYEAGVERRIIRSVSELCLQGLTESMTRAGVAYDSWDWESELTWNGRVQDTLDRMKDTVYVFELGGVLEFDAEKAVQDFHLREELGFGESYEVPSLTLVRSDGTTLYPTRDIAYTLWKFEKATKVINVIGMDQRLPQLQLKIALHALGHGDIAGRLVHFAYNLVSIPGYTMSSRTGRYIKLDNVMDEAVDRAYEEVSKRSPQLSDEEKKRISNFVGMGAVRYALVEVDPSKPVVFTWDRVLNFDTNSAPYIQYSHARACSILRKAAREPEDPPYELLEEELERGIILALAKFPNVFIEAAELLKPNMIADSANLLADKFNTFYNALPVIKAEAKLSDARLGLVDAVRIVLRNSLDLIGVFAPERM